jgi:hypothetical protein
MRREQEVANLNKKLQQLCKQMYELEELTKKKQKMEDALSAHKHAR